MRKNVKDVPPSPSIPIRLTPRTAATVKAYDPDRTGDHVLFRFQPTHVVKVRREDYTPQQVQKLEDWWNGLGIDSRPSPFVPDPLGTVIIWTFCGGDDADPDNGVYGDDCE